jgi:hypothetical protein
MGVWARIEALCKTIASVQQYQSDELRQVRQSVAYLQSVVDRLLPGHTKPIFPPIDKPRDPPIVLRPPTVDWPPVSCGPSVRPPDITDPLPDGPTLPGAGGRFDPSTDLHTPGHRHEIVLVSGSPVRYTLANATGLQAVSFTIAPTPMYGRHWFGERPSYDRWVTDAAGNTLLREDGMQLGGGSMYVKGPFTGPIYLHLKSFDFNGWVFVEFQR